MKPCQTRAFLQPLQVPFFRQKSAMAWTCSATTNDALIDNLVRNRLVENPRVEQALRLVDRRVFLPANTTPSIAYADAPQSISCAATISAPHMHAMALQLLNDHLPPGATALDVGAGSGYFAACMAALVGPTGRVVAIEHAPQLTQFAQENLDSFTAAIPSQKTCPITVRTADGRLGAEDYAPFTAIHVGAAAPNVPPALVSQLAPNGAMVIPIGPAHGSQRLDVISKDAAGNVSQRTVCHVRYVPLCDLDRQLRDY